MSRKQQAAGGVLMLVQIKKDHPQPRGIELAAAALRDGGVIAFPTDTTYGLGAHLFNRKAVEQIYLLKNHKRNKPLSILCADLAQVSRFAFVDDAAYRILRRCLPGPYTFILRARREVPRIMTSKRKTVGVRVPDHPVAQALIRALDDPIISTSAMSQQRQVLDAPETIQKALGHALAFVLDAGVIRHDPSTVVDLTGPEHLLIRHGKGALEPLGLEEKD